MSWDLYCGENINHMFENDILGYYSKRIGYTEG